MQNLVWTLTIVRFKEADKSLNMLIEAGADVNARANDGQTTLLYTAMIGLMRSMKILIKAGDDLNAGSDDRG